MASGNLYNLKDYRASRKKVWLAKNQKKLSAFLGSYLGKNVDISYQDLYSLYNTHREEYRQGVWDYQEFRDFLYDEMSASFMEDLYGTLCAQSWFDSKVFSKEQVLDYCLSYYIVSSSQRFG